MASLVRGDKPANDPARPNVWARVLLAAAVPAALGVVYQLSVSLGMRFHLFSSVGTRLGCQNSQMGCLGPALYVAPFVAVGAAFLLWLLLRIAGVRPASLVALAGLAITLVVGHAYLVSSLKSALSAPGVGLCLVLAVSYAAAAVLTASNVGRPWKIGIAVVIAALVPLSFL
jgi:hypothetical protein